MAHDQAMATHLDVLLIERRPGAGTDQAAALAAAGHRVHRCYADPTEPRNPDAPLAHLCVAVTDGTCPLDRGIDVALVARNGIAIRPTADEHGVTCAIRAGVPVVEDGSDLFDPYGPWLAERVGVDGAAAACERAAGTRWEGLAAEVRARTRLVLAASGVTPEEVEIRVETDGTRLHIVVGGPELVHGAEQALAVRVLDAVRTVPRTFSKVDVTYQPTA